MSVLYDYREALKAHIVAGGLGLSADDIIIKRQADIFSEIDQTMSMASNGVVLVISAGKGRNPKPDSSELSFNVTFRLTLYVQPVLQPNNKPEEDIFEPMALHVHGFTTPAYQHAWYKTQCVDWEDVPDTEYLARELTIQRLTNF